MTKTITLEPDDDMYNDQRTSIIIDDIVSAGVYTLDKIKDFNTGIREIRVITFKEKASKK